jgi:hypothetical protein
MRNKEGENKKLSNRRADGFSGDIREIMRVSHE